MRSGGVDEPIPLIIRAGQKISGYRLIKRRGRGGVAEVWEAESPGGFRVALKLVHLSADLRSGELRALKITRGIRHPNLLLILGAWQIENLLVLSMELADRSLWDRFLEVNVQGLRGIARSELLVHLSSVAGAIDYLNDFSHSVGGQHKVGIQHRDLKPQNILLIGDCAKVADFGLARVMEQNVTSHTGPCTLPYASPEYFSGQTSRQSDQYALAVTYCQLRGGRMPFPGTTAQIAVGHLCSDPDLEGLPEPERPIVARALAKRPEDRWPNCRSFIDALRSLAVIGEDAIPDTFPRDPREIHPDQAGEVDPLDSSAFVPTADSDFIPTDSGESDIPLDLFSSTGRWIESLRTRVKLGAASRTGPLNLDGRPNKNEAGLRVRIVAYLGSKWARIGLIAALLAVALVLSTRGVRTLADRSRHLAPSNSVTPTRTEPGELKTGNAVVRREISLRTEPKRSTPIVPVKETEGPDRSRPATPAVERKKPPSAHPHEANIGSRETVTNKESTAPPPVVSIRVPKEPPPENPALLVSARVVAPFPPPELTPSFQHPLNPVPDPEGVNSASATAGSSEAPGSRVESSPSAGSEETIHTPRIDLPSQVSVRVGRVEKLPVRVLHGDTSKPVQLGFLGLPHGVSVATPTIPAGSVAADIELSAAANASPGLTEVAVTFTTGKDRGEAGIKLNVLPPPPATLAFERGRDDLARSAYDRAVAAFTEAIQLDPASTGAHYYRGVAYHLQGRYREALADYSAALGLHPGNPEILLVRARVYMDLGEKPLALNDYTEAIRLQPDPKAYLARGCLQHMLGVYDRALADFDRALQLRPGDLATYYRRGLTRYCSGDNAGAIEDFTEVIRLDPKHAGAYRNRRDAFARMGENARASADHDTFERLSLPSTSTTSSSLGTR